MGQDSELRQQFDELMESGERAAAKLDGDALENVTERLSLWEEKLLKVGADEVFLQYVRKKLHRYAEICGFVAETMYAAFVYASREASSSGGMQGCYGKKGVEQSSTAQPVLMKTYG